MPEDTVAAIEARLRAALDPLALEIADDSAKHAGHPGAASGGGHYRVRVVSARFTGLPRLARHRLVYDAVADLMDHNIHALALCTVAADD